MELFVCWDGDKIGRRVGRAVLTDDVGEVRRVDQAINAGNELWRAFAVNVGGSVIEIGGDEGRICIDASRLGEVPGVAVRYGQTVGATLSVGVGMKLSDSAKALMIAKLRGGNQIIVWDQDTMQSEYEKASKPKDEKDKLAEEYLAKHTDPDPNSHSSAAAATTHGGQLDQNTVGKNAGAHAGFSTTHRPGFTTIDKAGDQGVGPDDPTTGSPEMTHAASDFEGQLHDAAQEQSSKDEADAKQSGDNADKVKQAVAKALTQVRQNLPLIAQLQQASPDAYQSILNLVQGVILLGKEVMAKSPPPPQDQLPEHAQNALGKAEELEKAVSHIVGQPISAKLQPHPRDAKAKQTVQKTDYTHHLPEDARNAGMKLVVTHTKTYPPPPSGFGGETIRAETIHPAGHPVGYVTAHVLPPSAARNKKVKAIEPHSELEDQYHGKGIGSAMYEAAYAHAMGQGIQRVEGGVHSEDAHRLHKRLSEKHGFTYRARKENVEYFPYIGYSYNLKNELPAEPAVNDRNLFGPGKGMTFIRDVELAKDETLPTEVHHTLPVGSTHNGKVKVQHADGTQSWKQMEAGMIQAQEGGAPLFGANSHPTSSREPGAR